MFRKHFKRLAGKYETKTGLNGYVYDFSVDYSNDAVDILGIHNYLMKKNDIVLQNAWVCKTNIYFKNDIFWLYFTKYKLIKMYFNEQSRM